jgi:hypothetical protein
MKCMLLFRVALAALAAIAFAGGSAGAAQPAGLVAIEGCSASKGTAPMSFMNNFGVHVEQPGLPPMLMIAFTDVSTKPLASIDFGLLSNDKLVAVVRDVGSFAPNAVVMHAFGVEPGAVPPANASVSCVALMAKYADGSTWINPQMPSR